MLLFQNAITLHTLQHALWPLANVLMSMIYMSAWLGNNSTSHKSDLYTVEVRKQNNILILSYQYARLVVS